jgi:hypothetical protein
MRVGVCQQQTQLREAERTDKSLDATGRGIGNNRVEFVDLARCPRARHDQLVRRIALQQPSDQGARFGGRPFPGNFGRERTEVEKGRHHAVRKLLAAEIISCGLRSQR